jgi:hypothetical protein
MMQVNTRGGVFSPDLMGLGLTSEEVDESRPARIHLSVLNGTKETLSNPTREALEGGIAAPWYFKNRPINPEEREELLQALEFARSTGRRPFGQIYAGKLRGACVVFVYLMDDWRNLTETPSSPSPEIYFVAGLVGVGIVAVGVGAYFLLRK